MVKLPIILQMEPINAVMECVPYELQEYFNLPDPGACCDERNLTVVINEWSLSPLNVLKFRSRSDACVRAS